MPVLLIPGNSWCWCLNLKQNAAKQNGSALQHQKARMGIYSHYLRKQAGVAGN